MLFVRLVNPQRKIGIVNETDKFERSAKDLKLVSAIFYQIFIFHQMIAVQKL